jgi:hypothetical protein
MILRHNSFDRLVIFSVIVAVKVGRLSSDYPAIIHHVWDMDNRDYDNNHRIVKLPPRAIRRLFGRLSKPIVVLTFCLQLIIDWKL